LLSLVSVPEIPRWIGAIVCGATVIAVLARDRCPVALAGCGFLALASFESLRIAQALALLATAAAAAWLLVVALQRRARLARIVVDLSDAPGDLRGALAALLGDPTLE